MKYVYVVMEDVPYEGAYYWAVYTTRAGASRAMKAFMKKYRRNRGKDSFSVSKEPLDMPTLNFEK
jgi:predicted mannosyl-3-phosphoglycerate phosphatase (HAD superfamily)